jgi:hypothetical protein
MNEQIELSKRELVTQLDRLEARAEFLQAHRAEVARRLSDMACERVRRHLTVLDRSEEGAA